MNPGRSSSGLRTFFLVLAVLAMGYTLWAGATGHQAALAAGTVLTLGLFAFGNIDRLKSFKTTATGIEAETRELARETRDTLAELRQLAVLVAKIQVSLLVRHGRLGGYREETQQKFRDQILALLRQIGVSEEVQRDVLTDVRQFAVHDYVDMVLGDKPPPGVIAHPHGIVEWTTLRNNALASPASPAALREFAAKYDCMTPEMAELITDYEHYLAHGAHRRPDIWQAKTEGY